MSFRDYSLDPAANTEIGGGIYVGPNMERAKVRPSLQQIAADGREVWDLVAAQTTLFPPAIIYRGNADPSAPPPAGAAPGDAYTANPGGVVGAEWGEPAAGTAVNPGDLLIKATDGTWHVVPSPVAFLTWRRTEIIAAEGQTDFATLGAYAIGYLAVFVNGVRLSATEFAATDGVEVVLAEPTRGGDVVLLEAFVGAGEAAPPAVEAYTDEMARDALGTALVAGAGIVKTLDDAADTITLAVDGAAVKPTESLIIACSDETTAITAGAGKATLRMPYAFTLTAVRASVTTAPTGSTILIDINEGGVSILSTRLMIDAGEKTSVTATTPAVISDAALADDAEISVDFDAVGSTIAGAGVKVVLIGRRA